jgi:toxin ParE1/3/4
MAVLQCCARTEVFVHIHLTPQARADLDSIWRYVLEQSGEELATQTVDAITDKFALFARFPNIGRRFDAGLRYVVRTFPIDRYVIFYSVRPGKIGILRVIHGSRNLPAAFKAN